MIMPLSLATLLMLEIKPVLSFEQDSRMLVKIHLDCSQISCHSC